MRVRLEISDWILLTNKNQLTVKHEADFNRFFLNCELFLHVQDNASPELLLLRPYLQR